MRTLTLTAFFLLVLAATVFGQSDSVPGEQFARPDFPAASLSSFRGKERIDLFLEFDKNGRVNDVTAFGPWISCSGSDAVADSLREAAIQAVKKITIPPATSGGKAIESSALIHYTIEGNQPPPPPVDEKNQRRGGVVNGTSISKPIPKYPSKARKFGIQGQAVIHVLIDETGKPITASAKSGHPLLLEAAAKAACNSRFTPTLLAGAPVKVMAGIHYNFNP